MSDKSTEQPIEYQRLRPEDMIQLRIGITRDDLGPGRANPIFLRLYYIARDLFVDLVQTRARAKRLREALGEARGVILIWRALAMKERDEGPESVETYERESPEMQRINSAIAESVSAELHEGRL
jgi:hypothetical protein